MTEFITPNLVGFIALALFMWKITRDISGVEKRLTEKIDGVTNRLFRARRARGPYRGAA